MSQKLLIVVPEADLVSMEQLIETVASTGWQQFVFVSPGPVGRRPNRRTQDISQAILDNADAFGATDTIVAKEIWCDAKTLNEREDLNI